MNLEAIRMAAMYKLTDLAPALLRLKLAQAEKDEKRPIGIRDNVLTLNPSLATMNQDERNARVASAALHFMAEDSRRIARLPKEHAEIAAFCCDAHNNEVLAAEGFRYPGQKTMKDWCEITGEPYTPTMISEWTKEQMMSRLIMQQQQQQQQQSCQGQGQGQGRPSGRGRNSGPPQSDGDLEPTNGTMSEAEREQLSQDAREARVGFASGQGKLAAAMKRMFAFEEVPTYDPKALLAQYMTKYLRKPKQIDRSRLSQSYIALAPHMDTPIQYGRRPQKKAELFIVVDTSGSMTEKWLSAAMGIIRQTIQALPCTITVIACDAAIHGVFVIDSSDRNALAQVEKIELKGGGGTDFRPAFEMTESGNGDLVIFITDTYGTQPSQPPKKPTIWLTQEGAPKLPFGRKIELPFSMC